MELKTSVGMVGFEVTWNIILGWEVSLPLPNSEETVVDEVTYTRTQIQPWPNGESKKPSSKPRYKKPYKSPRTGKKKILKLRAYLKWIVRNVQQNQTCFLLDLEDCSE
ncbi:hypothetical protein AGMMS50233_08290 [Endomicrobiia bacterium]|nr:hypothetical protein AGMMS50233_08290 [Endomicrobiia bacterium]